MLIVLIMETLSLIVLPDNVVGLVNVKTPGLVRHVLAVGSFVVMAAVLYQHVLVKGVARLDMVELFANVENVMVQFHYSSCRISF